jgi:hypothetical protein
LASAAPIVAAVAWAGLLVLVGLGGLMFMAALHAANSAVQEAAAGAVFGAGFVGVYVLVRAVDRLAGLAERISGRSQAGRCG